MLVLKQRCHYNATQYVDFDFGVMFKDEKLSTFPDTSVQITTCRTETIILDFSSMVFIDSVGVDTVKQVFLFALRNTIYSVSITFSLEI
jgi:hypothetical protein